MGFVGCSILVLLWFDFVVEICATGDSTPFLLALVSNFDRAFPASASFWWLLQFPSEVLNRFAGPLEVRAPLNRVKGSLEIRALIYAHFA